MDVVLKHDEAWEAIRFYMREKKGIVFANKDDKTKLFVEKDKDGVSNIKIVISNAQYIEVIANILEKPVSEEPRTSKKVLEKTSKTIDLDVS